MCAINKCLLYAFLCLAIFCEIDSKGQIPNDGTINIDDTLKGEVIEGSGRSGDDDDIDQEESSGGLEDDEDTPLLSSMTPGVPRGTGGAGSARNRGRGTDALSFEPGSGDGRQGNHGADDADGDDKNDDDAGVVVASKPHSSTDDDEILRRQFFASSPPPPPSLPPVAPSTTRRIPPSTQPPTTTTTTTTTTTSSRPTTTTTTEMPPRPPYRVGDDEDDDDDVDVGSGFNYPQKPSSSIPTTTTTTTTTTQPTTTTTTTTTTTSTTKRQMVDPVDYPEEDVVEEREMEVFGSANADDEDDEDSFVERGSGEFGVRSKGEVSKPPSTVNKPTKPNPTKFFTYYDGDKNKGQPEYEDDKNKIHHSGGTGYDEKNDDDDDFMGNEIPSIGKAVMGPKQQRNDSSLWTKPGILAGIIGAAVVGLLCAVLLVMFVVYRMRKKDEGSYDLDETTKRSPRINGYQRTNQNEFYA